MSNKLKLPEDLKESSRVSINLICKIAHQEYKRIAPLLQDLFVDLIELYAGKWTLFEACQVGYHNLDHALDVALAVARMSAGWNRIVKDQPIPEDLFSIGMAAALFHDAGYIKDKGDYEGRGGKYTFNHVERSMRIAQAYLAEKGWPRPNVELVPQIISSTDYYMNLDLSDVFDIYNEEIMARMVATADLVAQVADVDYLVRINDLFEELEEAYQFESAESLASRGIQIYASAREITDGTLTFYDQFVLPRLEYLGRMDRYLGAFFSNGRNPYQESIAANLSGHLIYSRKQWDKLGEILIKLGIVTHVQVERAVEQQLKQESKQTLSEKGTAGTTIKRLLGLMNKRPSRHRLGEILLEMEAVDTTELYQGLLTQILPQAVEDSISSDDLLFLLKVSLLLHNYNQDVEVFDYILKMTNEFLNCEMSLIRLIDHDTGEIVTALPTGTHSSYGKDVRLPMDKGLAGWVRRHGRAISIANDLMDEHVHDEINNSADLQPKSILVVPFHVNGEWVGVIELLNKKGATFTEHDKKIATSLANIIGLVLGNILMR